jgi:UDP-2,3-diacylglucosamine pyrophosphatase LpxH
MGKKQRESAQEYASKRLTELGGRELPELPLRHASYVLISDLHLGNGGGADDFRRNESTLAAALDHYHAGGYRLILLGDTEELWQFDIHEIRAKYDASIYARIQGFAPDRLHRVFGNHDIDWGSPIDPVLPPPSRTLGAPEGIKLTDDRGRPRILLAHGHQGTYLSDYKSWSSRFLVRLGRKVEPLLRKLGLWRNPSIPKTPVTKDFERIRYAWAKTHHVMLICGHSHRAVFASIPYWERLKRRADKLRARLRAKPDDPKADEWRRELGQIDVQLREERKRRRNIGAPDDDPVPCYFNTGCGLFTGGITAIEIANDEIRLVKWHRDARPEPRDVLQADSLSALLNKL